MAIVYLFVKENGRSPLEEYLRSVNDHRQLAAMQKSIERLAFMDGRLPPPIAKHVEGKIWELRTRFGNRVFYSIQEGNEIILLDGYTKKRDRIEARVLHRVRSLYQEYLLTRGRKPF